MAIPREDYNLVMDLDKSVIGLRGKSAKKTEYLKTLKLNKKQRSIIIGTLIGDATLEPRGKRPGYRYRFCQSTKRKDYVNHIQNVFSDWSLAGVGYSKKSKNCTNLKVLDYYYFQTVVHPSFDFYAHQFYKWDTVVNKRYKVVPKRITKWLDPVSIAYWFMDDGSNMRNTGYILNTQCFSLKENEIIADAIGRKFKIDVNIHKDRTSYRLYICSNSVVDFTNVVKPYILPCVEYKLINTR
jgi:hypothetical protein